jgi:hypothetical protein
MKSILLVTLVSAIAASAAWGQHIGGTETPTLLEEDYLFEVVKHLYRWYLDEADFKKIVGKARIAFWVRQRRLTLDPGDRSQFGEIVIPDLGVHITVKKADYAIKELGLLVRHDGFKIINVARGRLPDARDEYQVVTVSYQTMRDYAHRTRNLARFPEDALLMRMRLCARERILAYLENREKAGLENKIGNLKELRKQAQIVHLAPLSKVANDAWLFWETGRMLIRFASDIDLENPSLWDHDELAVRLYDIDEQTVVSLDEVAGSNAYMTRDQVGRALFNCIVLGRRVTLQPLDGAVRKKEANVQEAREK